MSPSRTGQNRVYLNKDRVRLKLILRGKRLGFSLAEVKTLFDMYDTNPNSAIQLEAMLEMTEQKRAVLKQQLEDIQMLMTELDDVEARCREKNSQNSNEEISHEHLLPYFKFFGLGEDIEMLRDQVYQFAQNEIAPLAEQADADNQFPNQLWTKLGDMGLLGVTVSEQYGGSDMGYLAHTIAMEEVSRASGGIGLSYGAH